MDSREVVHAVDALLKEKKIDKSMLSEIVESIFLSILKKKYNIEEDDTEKYFSVTFNIENGDVEIIHERVVVEDDEFSNPLTEIKLTDALKIDEDAEVGEDLPEIIDLGDFGRRNIITAKQILIQKIKKVEKHQLYEVFKSKIGEIITGSIHQINSKEIKIHYEDIELILQKSDCVFNERYRRGELIKVLVKDVVEKNQDVKILVSRADKNFIKRLFELEVPEISDGIINIINIARKPGIRTKVVLETLDHRVDPVGACVGQRGSRISAIVSELNKEKVDIIHYIPDMKMLITRLLGIKTEYQIDLNPEKKTAEIVISDGLIKDVRGYKNSNLELAEEITGYKLSAITESEFERQNELRLDDVKELDELILVKLKLNGYNTAEDVFNARKSDLLHVDGINEDNYQSILDTLNKYYADEEEDEEI